MAHPPILEGRKLNLIYKNRAVQNHALNNVDIAVQAQKINIVWGPNGAGKSSLLKVLVGLIKAESGEILKSQNLRMTFLPQKKELRLDLPLSVFDVVSQGLKPRLFEKISFEQQAQVEKALQFTGLLHLQQSLVSDLSGGELQKTLIARALITQPDLLVLDEPLNSLDHTSKMAVMDLLKSLTQQNKTVLVSLHDLDLIKNYADIVFYLDKSVKDSGSAEKVFENVFNS